MEIANDRSSLHDKSPPPERHSSTQGEDNITAGLLPDTLDHSRSEEHTGEPGVRGGKQVANDRSSLHDKSPPPERHSSTQGEDNITAGLLPDTLDHSGSCWHFCCAKATILAVTASSEGSGSVPESQRDLNDLRRSASTRSGLKLACALMKAAKNRLAL